MINVLDHHGEFILVPHGACTIWAEEFFSRMRSAEIGQHHQSLALVCSATRKRRHGARITAVRRMAIKFAGLAMKRKQSADFTEYWQRHRQELPLQ